MFASTGLFKDVPCPKGTECSLTYCIFSHTASPPDITVAITPSHAISNGSEKEVTLEGLEEPARKKRRVDLSPTRNESETSPPRQVKSNTEKDATSLRRTVPLKSKPANEHDHGSVSISRRPISPPPTRQIEHDKTSQAAAKSTEQKAADSATLKKESLLPRLLDHAPASHHTRMAILKQMHAGMAAQNEKAKKDTDTTKVFILSEQELITMALDEEEKIAKTKPAIYTNILKTFIMQLRKMDLAEWRKLVTETYKSKFMVAVPPKPTEKVISTGLTTKQEIIVLTHLQTALQGLERFGYVTSPPTAAEILSAKQGVEAAMGFEKCERCATRFQVYPGRREEDGALTSGGSCKYHWAKIVRPQRQRTNGFGTSQSAFYPCCNEVVGQSTGCTVSPHHVFKVSEVKRLASIWQFEHTPENNHATGLPSAVAFDAEMGYTTKGMEIIRLTAVSWPSGKELLDVLVRPLGEILDLNTHFSGITLSQMANAIPYNQPTQPDQPPPSKRKPSSASEDGELSDDDSQAPLRIVRSPQTARSLLFSLLTPTTPLIGHAIDNDLNVIRIIHPFIIDTVLLYPHPKGLPIRFGLKMLSSKYLDRDIQKTTTGGEGDKGDGEIKGHDSKEDAIATGDLVRVKVGEKWKELKKKGWKFGEGGLVQADNKDEYMDGTKRKLG